METPFRRYIRDLLAENGVWSAAIEHRSGGTTGVGDLLVQIGEYAFPVEAKTGRWSLVADILHSSRIRPAQIRFLDEASRAGLMARLVIGVPDLEGWSAWMMRDVRAERLSLWREGFARTELECVARGNKLLLRPTQW